VRIALVGTRGPGFYGGFETCVAELAPRLAERGHGVIAYARRWSPARAFEHPGVCVVSLPSVATKNLDTVTHTALSTAHLLVRGRVDVAVFFGVGNSPWARTARRLGVPVVLNVDGLDRLRAKWGRFASWYLGRAEEWSARAADVLVTDARSVERYYADVYHLASTYVPYGAPERPATGTATLDSAGLQPGSYILYVSRFEPENNAHVLLEAYARSGLDVPLVLVGGSPYESSYEQSLHLAAGPGVRFLGFVFGEGYRELQSHAMVYAQCTEVGGAHPALIEAMGFGNAIVALDNPEHREVLGEAGIYYTTTDELCDRLVELCRDARRREDLAESARRRAGALFSWDAVTTAYEGACREAIDRRGRSRR